MVSQSSMEAEQNEHYSRIGFPVRYFGFFRKTCSDSIHWHENTASSFPETSRSREELVTSFLVLSDKLVFPSVHTPHQVSLILRDSEKDGSPGYVAQSRAVSQCFLPNRKLRL